VSSLEQIAENMKIGAIGGAEYRKMKTGVINGAEHRKNEKFCLRWSKISAPLMTPVFMFSVLCSTDDTSYKNWCHQWRRIPKT
jgi:hypothetical protein